MDLSALHAAGFRYILSLDAREHRLLDGKDSGIEIELIHLPDSIPPLPLEKKIYEIRLPEAVDRVIGKLEEGAVLLHCHAGCDRTGGVLTGYLSRTRGLAPAEALQVVREANPSAISAEGYEAMILDVLERSQ
jgi:protein-tyrosine phosphatase